MTYRRSTTQIGSIIAMIICSTFILTNAIGALDLRIAGNTQHLEQGWTNSDRRIQPDLSRENDQNDKEKLRSINFGYLHLTPSRYKRTCECNEYILKRFPEIWRRYTERGCQVSFCTGSFKLRNKIRKLLNRKFNFRATKK